jgi:TolB-like protein/DNA-binding winged helix-turn-helix (wHTH) protein
MPNSTDAKSTQPIGSPSQVDGTTDSPTSLAGIAPSSLRCAESISFGPFRLVPAARVIEKDGTSLELGSRALDILIVLAEHAGEIVSARELIARVWRGLVVEPSGLRVQMTNLRRALGDGQAGARYVINVPGQGYSFVAPIVLEGESAHRLRLASQPPDTRLTAGMARPLPAVQRLVDGARPSGGNSDARHPQRGSRPSLAVLPFRIVGEHIRYQALASALPDELITELSCLRWLFITARGSSFRVRAAACEFGEIGRLLGVRYCLWGTLEISGRRLVVTVELVDTLDEGIVWADRFSGRIDDVHSFREEIRRQVLVALDVRIPMHEAARARLSTPDDLNAWSAYHLGLQHVYRYTPADNAAAAHLFQRAVTLDPSFARAHAGLSFVHFQTAMMRYTADIKGEVAQARRCAERGLELDPIDPFVNFTMGRSYWIDGDLDSCWSWLERATNICPNYAQAIYSRGMTEALAGRTVEGRAHADLAMRLSPIDPLYYAMLGARAFAHMAKGEDFEAAEWAERSACSPGAHALAAMIAAAAHSLNGQAARAAWWAAKARERSPALGREDFFRAFPMVLDTMRTRVTHALTQLGF